MVALCLSDIGYIGIGEMVQGHLNSGGDADADTELYRRSDYQQAQSSNLLRSPVQEGVLVGEIWEGGRLARPEDQKLCTCNFHVNTCEFLLSI